MYCMTCFTLTNVFCHASQIPPSPLAGSMSIPPSFPMPADQNMPGAPQGFKPHMNSTGGPQSQSANLMQAGPPEPYQVESLINSLLSL